MSGHLNVTAEQFAAFRAMDRTQPIHMFNLVRLKEWAEYKDGTRASGAEAYGTYGKLSAPIFAKAGGEIIWRGS
ncbi:MAG: DUF1330 domain-containing protein, partial [Sedimentitalea sp.]